MTKPRAPPLWRQYENQHITLLTDIRTVFNRYDKDRLRTEAELIPAPAGLEDSPWGEWTGLDGTAVPHMLTQGDIGRLLRPFAIRSKTLWPPGRRQGKQSACGYSRQQFEAAWASCCASHHHRQAKSDTCPGREQPHARHTFGMRQPCWWLPAGAIMRHNRIGSSRGAGGSLTSDRCLRGTNAM
jgi:hypothetical protein